MAFCPMLALAPAEEQGRVAARGVTEPCWGCSSHEVTDAEQSGKVSSSSDSGHTD